LNKSILSFKILLTRFYQYAITDGNMMCGFIPNVLSIVVKYYLSNYVEGERFKIVHNKRIIKKKVNLQEKCLVREN